MAPRRPSKREQPGYVEAVTVRLVAPTRGGREGFSCFLTVYKDMVVHMDLTPPFMRGWSGEAVRKFCRDVGWSATIAAPSSQ